MVSISFSGMKTEEKGVQDIILPDPHGLVPWVSEIAELAGGMADSSFKCQLCNLALHRRKVGGGVRNQRSARKVSR